MKNRLILCMGSNFDPEKHMFAAEKRLRALFSAIRFSGMLRTKPVGEGYRSFFLNRVAVAYTERSRDEVSRFFKTVEREMGRTAESKIKGLIPMDIDLLQWNDVVLKPEDMQREYVRLLLPQIINESTPL